MTPPFPGFRVWRDPEVRRVNPVRWAPLVSILSNFYSSSQTLNQMLKNRCKLVFVLGRLFRHILAFVSLLGAYLSEVPFRCSILR